MFPPQGSPGSSGSPLDGPPPSPQSVGAGPMGQPTPFSLQAIAPPVQSAQMPPEILTAIVQSAQNIGSMLDSYAQATPDLASDWGMVKDALQTVLAKLLTAGAGATSPTAAGSPFPAAFDRGIAGPGAF